MLGYATKTATARGPRKRALRLVTAMRCGAMEGRAGDDGGGDTETAAAGWAMAVVADKSKELLLQYRRRLDT